MLPFSGFVARRSYTFADSFTRSTGFICHRRCGNAIFFFFNFTGRADGFCANHPFFAVKKAILPCTFTSPRASAAMATGYNIRSAI